MKNFDISVEEQTNLPQSIITKSHFVYSIDDLLQIYGSHNSATKNQYYTPKHDGFCFANAYLLSEANSKLDYYEGIAGPNNVVHAWCQNAKGEVIDTTWGYVPNCHYYGVRIDPTLALICHGLMLSYDSILEFIFRYDFVNNPKFINMWFGKKD